MADSESSSDYSSDDEEYVPDENESDSMPSDEEEEVKVKMMKRNLPLRERKGGIKLEEEGEEEEDAGSGYEQTVVDSELAKLKEEKQEASKKARIDDLWADFKKDTKTTQATKPTSSYSPKGTVTTESLSTTKPQTSKTKQVTISKTYDFAGETVTVTKTVDAESTEGKQTKQKEEAKPADTPIVPGMKRPTGQGGLSGVLGQLGKRPKMSTLEKSKHDWDTFKKDEGLEEELTNFNKDGYLEKKSFLQRTDERQFERERDVRVGMRKM